MILRLVLSVNAFTPGNLEGLPVNPRGIQRPPRKLGPDHNQWSLRPGSTPTVEACSLRRPSTCWSVVIALETEIPRRCTEGNSVSPQWKERFTSRGGFSLCLCLFCEGALGGALRRAWWPSGAQHRSAGGVEGRRSTRELGRQGVALLAGRSNALSAALWKFCEFLTPET